MKKSKLIKAAILGVVAFAGVHKIQSATVGMFPNPEFPLQNDSIVNPVIGAVPKQIRIGLILDTSNSMDGLIDQAKSQLWGIINKLSNATANGVKPSVMIALYELGNDNNDAGNGYIRKVVSLTTDLDEISQELFSLSTKGGDEYCGQAIQKATNELDWSSTGEDLQILLLAGNESFKQGSVSFKEACSAAKKKGILINTIYCGDYESGVNEYWKKGAELTGGIYSNINHNQKNVAIETPYDDQIGALNDSLNTTYIVYGEVGVKRKERQKAQDMNAKKMGKSVYTSRSVSKSRHIYNNSTWDLVDASNEKDFSLEKIDKKTLPRQIQNASTLEVKLYIENKEKYRKLLKARIGELANLRATYIQEKKADKMEKSLDDAIILSILKQGENKGFKFPI